MSKKLMPKEEETIKLICGVVMPISSIDGCNENHWADVYDIISEAIQDAGFDPNLVSNADEIGVIQKRIIQNLYENPIVVCDVSGKNPNVMFELGIRLAFDKPTIIIKDDKTSYSFDTSPIEHLEYPRDLRFNKMVDFKEKLSDRLKKTYDISVKDESYSTFLKHFGEFKIAKIDQKEVSEQEYILDELKSLRSLIINTNRYGVNTNKSFLSSNSPSVKKGYIYICLRQVTLDEAKIIQNIVKSNSDVLGTKIKQLKTDHIHIDIIEVEGCDLEKLRMDIQESIGNKFKVIIR